MKPFFKDLAACLKLVIIPPFLYVCSDFLFRLSEMNLARDALLSFAFVFLGLMLVAFILALIAALLQQIPVLRRAITLALSVATTFLSLFIVLIYLKWWFFSFTLADDRGLFVIRFYYVVLAAAIMTGFGVFLVRKKSELLQTLQEMQRRLSVMVIMFSLISFVALAANFFVQPKKQTVAGKSQRLNVLLILVDTLTAHSLASHGYPNRTPFFENLARQSLFFTNVRANVTATGPSISSLLTGRSPMTSHVLGDYHVSGETAGMNLFTLFEAAGYRTESLHQIDYASPYFLGFPSPTEGEANLFQDPRINDLNRMISRWARRLGFSLKFQFRLTKNTDLLLADVFDETNRRFTRLTGTHSPFFLYTHIFLPSYVHHDFGPGVNAAAFKEINYCNFYTPEKQPFIDQAKVAYEKTVSELDYELGRFIGGLKSTGLLENTLVIITADHGDSFEKGYWGHGNDLSESSIQVPLFILTPDKQKRIVNNPVALCDLAPTLLDLAGMPIPGWMDCRSAMSGTPREQTVTFNFLVENSVRDRPPYPGLSTGHSITLYDKGDKFILRPAGKTSELYDLKADPGENNNLASANPQKAAALEQALMGLLEGNRP